MERFLLYFILTLTIFGCKKDDDSTGSLEKDYSSFLAQTVQSFRGKLNENSFSWSFAWSQFQKSAGYGNANGGQDTSESVRIIFSGLVSPGAEERWFNLYSPKYNSASESEFLQVFSLGRKKLGDYRSDFYLEIFTNKNLYQSNNSTDANEIEILKTHEFTDDTGRKLRVWFRINANLVSSGSNVALTNGLMIGEFYGFKK